MVELEKYYPVIIPTLNRYEHFNECVESLSKCTHAEKTELIIGLDFPSTEKYVEGWKKIKDYIPSITGFKKVTVLERVENYGAHKNSVDLQNYALSKYDAYIFTEDDNIFSPCFLDFINKGLNKYKDDQSVLAVCGYSYPNDWETDKNCVIQHQYFSAWGYGEWGNRLKKIQEENTPKFYKKFILEKTYRKDLSQSPINKMHIVSFAFAEKLDIFDITRSTYMFATKKGVLMPTKTLVKNTGWDGSGEHCDSENLKISNQKVSQNQFFEEIDVKERIFSKNLEKLQKEIFPDYSKKMIFISDLIYCCVKLFGIKKTIVLKNTIKKLMKRK